MGTSRVSKKKYPLDQWGEALRLTDWSSHDAGLYDRALSRRRLRILKSRVAGELIERGTISRVFLEHGAENICAVLTDIFTDLQITITVPRSLGGQWAVCAA